MFLIMSAAYVGQDLKAEFGAIPPSFLPLGNKRLFQHQIAKAPTTKKVFLSVPQSYQVQDFDRDWLENHEVTLLPLPDGLSLGESLMSAIALIEQPLDSDLSVLYGDTLISPPSDTDIVSISHVDSTYDWATINGGSAEWLDAHDDNIDSQSQVVSGYFNFSSPKALIRCLSQTHWHFLNALNLYHKTNGLKVSKCSDWLDFGHVNTYYRSKAKYTTQRAFNELKITTDWIEKSSSKNIKIQAESHWFQNIPNDLKHFTPQFIGESKTETNTSYRLEYLYQNALNELFVFARLPEITWRQIFTQMQSFLSACKDIKAPLNVNVNVDSLESLFNEKTQLRLQEFCRDREYDWNQPWQYNGSKALSLKDLHIESVKRLPSATSANLMHGDFCFSNVLYDFRKNRIKVIDPRGITAKDELSIFGYTNYDIAKICHSVLGLYDWIIAGYYKVSVDNYQVHFELADTSHLSSVQSMFSEILCAEYSLDEASLYAMQIQLFLSMLPLHSDDPRRQDALMANAFRLYYKMLEIKA